MQNISRRNILQFGAMAPLLLTGACATSIGRQSTSGDVPASLSYAPEPVFEPFEEMYAERSDGGFLIPAAPYKKIGERYLRQVVDDPTGEAPGTIVVDTGNYYLYLVLPGRRAIRYGVGLGRAGFAWTGRAEIRRKAAWPKWHPPAEMIDREPRLEKYRTTYDKATNTYLGGMEGGLSNPLGARALYLYEGNIDTLYRLHGTYEWNSIGKSVSAGCVRLINQDVIDLYERTKANADVLVR